MNEARFLEIVSGRRRGVAASLCRMGLAVASIGYRGAITLRNMAYDRQWFKSYSAAVPVVSLGNLTTGGTGKTPVAAWIANWCLSRGVNPGLLSRGYRSLEGQAEGTANDEKRVLDRLCPQVPHVQQRDRVQGARRLTGEFQCSLLILDDGFQHRRLRRDLDIVLIDALEPWGYGHLLPRGLLREPLSSLRRADLILITRADHAPAETREQIRRRIQAAGGPGDCVDVAFTPQRLIGDSIEPCETVRGARVLAFCGIGNPDGFRQTLTSLGCQAILQAYPDHYHYRPLDLEHLARSAREASVDMVLTTLKDLVKIPPGAWTGPPLRAVDIGVSFPAGNTPLVTALERCIDEIREPR